MISSEGMMQAGMNSPGINKGGHGHLVYPPQPLVIRMRNDPEYKFIIYGDKSIYRVIYDLPLPHIF
jgi:hypothetical protein